jgi:hypothetical protein
VSLRSAAQRHGVAALAAALLCETDDADYTAAWVQGRRHQMAGAGFVSRCSNMAGTQSKQSKSGLNGANLYVSVGSFSSNQWATTEPMADLLAVERFHGGIAAISGDPALLFPAKDSARAGFQRALYLLESLTSWKPRR